MATTVTKSPAKTKAYLDAWLTEAPDDAAGIARALGDIARARGMSHRWREMRGSAERACTRPSARTATQALPRS